MTDYIEMNDEEISKEVQDFAFICEFNNMSNRAWNIADSKGFHEDPRSLAEEIALMHSELSEALEYNRKNDVEAKKSDHIPDFSGEEEELADCIIRIMDTAKSRNFRIGPAIVAKLAYNASRPYRHGKAY